jgi:hypothetical protein
MTFDSVLYIANQFSGTNPYLAELLANLPAELPLSLSAELLLSLPTELLPTQLTC